MCTYYNTKQLCKSTAKGAPHDMYLLCYGYADHADKLQDVYNGLTTCFINKDGTPSYTKSVALHLLRVYGHLHVAEEQALNALQKIDTNEILPTAEHTAIVQDICKICKKWYNDMHIIIEKCILQIVARHHKRGHPVVTSDYKLDIQRGKYNNLFCGYAMDNKEIYTANGRKRRVVINKDGSRSATKGLVLTALEPFIPENNHVIDSAQGIVQLNIADALYTLQNNEITNTPADLQIVQSIIQDIVPAAYQNTVYNQWYKCFMEYCKATQQAA